MANVPVSFSLSLVDIARLVRELASWRPNAILAKARELSFDPTRASSYYLVYLSRVSSRRDNVGVADAIGYLLDHCSVKRSALPADMDLRGSAHYDNESIVLVNNASTGSQAVINAEIGDRLFWGIRYVVTIEAGTETKLEMADMVFAVNSEDHPSSSKTKVFRWDHSRNTFGEIVQESHLVARRDSPLLVTLFLWDRRVWYLADDKLLFNVMLSSFDREKWRTARPTLNSWNSRVRLQNFALFDLQFSDSTAG